MNTLREQLITEIQRIPDSRLQEVYEVIHFFRLGLNSVKPETTVNIRQFAGAWSDMDDEMFADFDKEWRERRYPRTAVTMLSTIREARSRTIS